MKNLIIVESPTKARTLGRFLGSEYLIDSTMGHIRDLPKSKLGVDIENDFAPQYVVVGKKRDAIKKLREDAKGAGQIFLATDPDREGEAIAYHVAELLRGNSKLSRIVFHEITEDAIKHALGKPGAINMQLVDAQQTRRVLDRLVGYKLSPLLWKKVRRGLSAGRVQSVAVRLIVDREREIEAFVPEEFWEVWCELARGTRDTFLAKLIEKNGEKIKIGNEKDAKTAVSDLEKADYSVAGIEKKKVVRRPSPPFTTSTMTQAAARAYFWSAKRTMSVAQKLYEEGLITYHRTDSTNLSKEAIFKARTFIEKEYGKDYVPERPRFYKTKSKVTQEAHEAVRPTDVRITSIGRDAEKLYSLIWKRFVASQMSDAVYDETVINVEAVNGAKYLLQTRGQIMKFAGWRKVYDSEQQTAESGQLPDVSGGEPLELIKIDPQQKFSEPQPRYTEATLIKTLEKLGIGRPSTYAPIISTIQERQYAEKVEGKFNPTLLGVAVNDFLVKNFPDIVDYQFTAEMEGDLDEIANGKTEWVPVIREFWEPFSEKLSGVEEKAKRVKVEVEETGEICPKCKVGKQVIRVGRFGKFLSCSRFPECDFTAPLVQTLEMKCPECAEGEVIIRKTRRGKRFYGCSRYPSCRWASWRKPSLDKKTIS